MSHNAVGTGNIPNLVLLSTLAPSRTKCFLAEVTTNCFLAEVTKVTNMVGVNLQLILDADEKFCTMVELHEADRWA